MSEDIPTTDDRPIWDLWMSVFRLPAVTVADELTIFDTLAATPAPPAELAERLATNARATRMLLRVLAALGFLVRYGERYHVTDVSRNFLLRSSPFYWGPVLRSPSNGTAFHEPLLKTLTGTASAGLLDDDLARPVEGWEKGELDPETARRMATFMHAHSLPAALGLARSGALTGINRLLDVGGGSACFSIALAQSDPALFSTVGELPAMCRVAAEYIRDAGMTDRVDTVAVDMFREDWPTGHDGILMSNILHDWSPETGALLLGKAYAALPPGGRIFIHEILLDETADGTATAAAFSLLMMINVRGQQFTFAELAGLLTGAGFADVDVTPTYGHYALVTARKP